MNKLLAVREQIIEPNMKRLIKAQIDYDGRCQFRCDIFDEHYCHFLSDPECGNYREMHLLEMAERQEFYRCGLW